MPEPATIRVEVCYALSDRQVMVALTLSDGVTVGEAIQQSGLLQRFSEIDLDRYGAGVYGKRVELDSPARAGDRIEIYRPLRADPKQRRRRVAREGGTMNRKIRG